MVFGEGLHHLLQAPIVLQSVVALSQSLLIPALYVIGHCLLPVHNKLISQILFKYSDNLFILRTKNQNYNQMSSQCVFECELIRTSKFCNMKALTLQYTDHFWRSA